MDRKYFHLLVAICVVFFVVGIGLITLGYFIAADDLQLKTKVISGKVSALMVVGFFLSVLPIIMVFVGPALANRIAKKK